MSDFKKLNLSPKILSALEKKGYLTPTPIQLQSIPHLLEGKDLLGIAQTGTGKTAAFSLPILDNLSKSANVPSNNNARALILTPTRELAGQIVDNIKLYGQDLGLKYAVIFGGVGISNQIKSVQKGLDIIVATPGRLLDLMNQGHIKFSQLEIFVLDEADRMLDMGFINDVRKIIAKLPKERQTLFFSATMPKDVAVLANSILNNPVRVEVTPQSSTVEKIDQKINLVEKANKPLLLKSILDQEDAKSVLVFSKTKHGANRIVEFLEKQSIKVAAIHGNKSQSARERALDSFRHGHIKVLIATDIAARGIDIPAITHVVNYDIPHDPENYVHRIGRTARAGRNGVAISFCDNSERGLLKEVEKLIGLTIAIDETHAFHNVKSTAEARSSLDKRERPKSGYRSTSKPRLGSKFNDDRPKSYFSENRRWKNGDNNVKKPFFKDDRKPGFGEERSKVDRPERLERQGNDPRPERSERSFFGRRNQEPRDRESRNQEPRSQEARTPRPGFARKFVDKFTKKFDNKFGGESNRDRNSTPRFSDDRRPGGQAESRPYFKKPRENGERKFDNRGPSFGDNKNRRFKDHGDERRSSGGDENRSSRPFFKDYKGSGKKFDGAEKRGNTSRSGGHGAPKTGSFGGGKRFNNDRNNNGGKKPTNRY